MELVLALAAKLTRTVEPTQVVELGRGRELQQVAELEMALALAAVLIAIGAKTGQQEIK